MAMFTFPDEKFQHLSGGICHCEGDLTIQSKHSNTLYLYGHEIEEMIVVSRILCSINYLSMLICAQENNGGWG